MADGAVGHRQRRRVNALIATSETYFVSRQICHCRTNAGAGAVSCKRTLRDRLHDMARHGNFAVA